MYQTFDRWSRYSLIFVLALSPILIYALINLPIGSSSVHTWLPDGKPERERYERFQKEFGNDQFLIASWEGCTRDDPRLELLKEQMQIVSRKPSPLIASVQTTKDVFDSLTNPPLKLSVEQATNRLKGIVVGNDGTAAIIVQFTSAGLANQNESIRQVYQLADKVPGLTQSDLRMAGTVYESFAVDQAAEESLKKLVAPSCFIGILLAWICLRSVRAAVAVLLIAGVGQLLAISVVYYTGGKFSAVLIVLPTLVFMLTLSGAVHLMNYYHDVKATDAGHRGVRAMMLGLKPTVLSSLTTSLGMASLAISQLAPVREFGIYSAVSLTVATTFLLLGFPVVSDLICGPRKKPKAVSEQLEHEIADQDSHSVLHSPGFARYIGWMERNAIPVSAIGFAILGFSFYGLLFLKSSTQFDDLFPRNSPTVRDMSFIEQHIGPIASLEVLVRFTKDKEFDELAQATSIENISREIRKCPDVGAVVSGISFIPTIPKTSRTRDVVKRGFIRRALVENFPKLVEERWVAEGETTRTWRITAKVSALGDDDYGTMSQRVREAVSVGIASISAEHPNVGDIIQSTEITGLSPVMHETQHMLLDDLGASFTVAFILITPVMMLIARGFWAGLLIMVPNVLPETLVFGTMAWLGFKLDVAGLLTASVAMGIAVNDTLHFVNWYSNRLSIGDSRADAITNTMSHCAVAMFHTMLISCCSMLPFLFAEFIPTRQFACLMIAMIGSSILGDLVLLPALLLGPLGRCLTGKRTVSTKKP